MPGIVIGESGISRDFRECLLIKVQHKGDGTEDNNREHDPTVAR